MENRRDTVYTDEFCRTHGRIIYALALRTLRDTETARDVVQEVWLRMFRYEGKFRGEAERATYMYRITTNECFRRIANTKVYDQLEEDDLPPDEDDPHQTLEKSELMAEVERCLARLTPLQSAVLTLHIYGERSYKEIAEALSLSQDVVNGAISRGRMRMKRMLRKRGITL